MLERNGNLRSFHVPHVPPRTPSPTLANEFAQDTRLMTEEPASHTVIRRHFDEHGIVKHGDGGHFDGDNHTNTVEGYSPF